MASTKLSFEDKVPPLECLLGTGVPSVAALDMYIADLDVDLEENTRQLDSCLKDMLKVTNSIVGKEYVTPRDALLSMISNHILEKDSCYDPEPDSVTDIMAHAANMLQEIPGCEEAVFQDLLSLSSEQGLSLPLRSAVVDPIASTMSLNAVSDSSEMQISQQWDQIALHLRKYFLDRLSQLPVSPKKPEIDIGEGRRLKYLQALITLQPVDEVWDRYQGLRRQQIERCLGMLLPDTESDTMDFLKISENCQEISRLMIQMMNEDFNTLSSGVLKKPPNIFQAFHKIYLEKYSDEMSALIDEIWDEIRDSVKRGPSQSFSAQGSTGKGKAKKTASGNLLRSQAQSLESVVSNRDNTESEKAPSPRGSVIPVKYVKTLHNIVTTVLEIEEHVDNLQKASIWDVGGLATKKLTRKGSLKGVLKPRASPELGGRRPNSASMSVDSDSWMSDSMMSSYSSASMFDAASGPKVTVIEKMKMEEKIRWDWKLIFKKIAPELAHCVKHHIRNATTELLSLEQDEWKKTHSLSTVTVPESLWGGRLDYPKVISKAVADFIQELEMFVLFAKAGVDGFLHTVRSEFVEVTNSCLKNVHSHLTKMSCDVPLQSPMKNLYVIVSSAAYIRNYLLHYDTILASDSSSKKPFLLQYKLFVTLVDTLTDQVTQKHNNYIATCVLHDANSHNWTETKEFYEGERCSFPVQMWNFCLRGIQHDMWTICPPKLAQTTFSVILHDSLQIFAQRYSRCTPSFRRIDQFRGDIMSILLCISELFYMSSNSISQCVDAGHSQVPHYAIHNLCTTLLSTLAVVASPLEVLYKVNKKGYRYRQKRKSYSQADRGCHTHWLSWIQPTLIDRNVKSYDDMRTTTAVYLHTKLLLCQPELNYPLTLQAYFMKDYTLSILFLTQAVSCIQPIDPSQTGAGTTSGEPNNDNSVGPDETAVREFTASLIRVMLNASQFTDAIAKILLPVIDRCQDWHCLDARHVPGKDMPVPLWMECIFACMKPFVQRVVKPVIDFVLSQSEEKQITPISSVIEELPCGCRSHATTSTPRSSRKSDVGRDMVDNALRLIVSQMSEDIFVLPTSVCVLLKLLEDQCVSKGIKTPHHCVGLKVVAVAIREYFLNTTQMSEHLGMTLNQTIKDDFKLLSDCVYHVLVSGKVKGSTTPRLAGRFCKDNKDWVNDKLQIVTCYLRSEIFDVNDAVMPQGATTEFMDQLYMSLTSDTLSTATGGEDVERLYWMLYNNQEWLQTQLDIKHVLPLISKQSNVPFVVNIARQPQPSFYPLVEHQRIGPCQFDHTVIQQKSLDWEKLLQSDLGLSEFGFRALLYNRHEMQDGAFLEENEKKPVATLRAVFENEPRELG